MRNNQILHSKVIDILDGIKDGEISLKKSINILKKMAKNKIELKEISVFVMTCDYELKRVTHDMNTCNCMCGIGLLLNEQLLKK